MAIIGPAEIDGDGEMVFHRKFKFVEPGEESGLATEVLRIQHDGEVTIAEESRLFLLTIPLPTAPELTEEMKGTLDLVKMTIDMNWGSLAVVPLDPDVADRMASLYDFVQVEPAVYQEMCVWQTEMLPGCLFVQYVARSFLVSVPHAMYESGVQENGTVVMNLLRTNVPENDENGENNQ